MTSDRARVNGGEVNQQQPPGSSFVTVADTVVRLFNPELAQSTHMPAPALLHQFMFALHQRWLERALGAGWSAPYQHDVWTLHLREIPIMEFKRYRYSHGKDNYRGCCKISLAGRAEGHHGTLWCSMQYVPSIATKTIEVVVGAEWEPDGFFGGRAYCRGNWPDRHLPVLEPVITLLDGVPGLEAAIRTTTTLDTTPAEELFEGSRNDEEALSVIDRARLVLTEH